MDFTPEQIAKLRTHTWRVHPLDTKTLDHIKRMLQEEGNDPEHFIVNKFIIRKGKQHPAIFYITSLDIVLSLRNGRHEEEYEFLAQHKVKKNAQWADWKEGEKKATEKGKNAFNCKNEKPRNKPGLTWRR